MLPESDVNYLEERNLVHEISTESGLTCVVFPNWKLPAGYQSESANLLLRLSGGYPDIAPDMWWFEPAILRSDGTVVPATEVTEGFLGKTWQRWSRHLQPEQWRSGMDGLENYLALIQHEITRCATGSLA